jgi:4-amino-4-deoxychorismate lyase
VFTPGTGLGILDGTTQANVFRFAEGLGLETGFELATPADLLEADAAWLVSSVRLAAPVRAIDGRPMAVDGDFTRALNEHLLALRD